jgi:predicted N-acetyltransferase YhbS
MEFITNYLGREAAIVNLFEATFTVSENAQEGALIGELVAQMLSRVAPQDIVFCAARHDDTIRAAVVFTRVRYAQDDRTVFILSPMAVATEHQGTGLGQRLINYGLDKLRAVNVDTVLTYGDINFYAKSGFAQISVETAAPPLPLSYPHGWLGQSLTDQPLTPLRGASHCVEPLNNPAYW